MSDKTDREICEAATPGPWEDGAEKRGDVIVDGVFADEAVICLADDPPSGPQQSMNMQYIAHNDPVRVSALLDVMEAARDLNALGWPHIVIPDAVHPSMVREAQEKLADALVAYDTLEG